MFLIVEQIGVNVFITVVLPKLVAYAEKKWPAIKARLWKAAADVKHFFEQKGDALLAEHYARYFFDDAGLNKSQRAKMVTAYKRILERNREIERILGKDFIGKIL